MEFREFIDAETAKLAQLLKSPSLSGIWKDPASNSNGFLASRKPQVDLWLKELAQDAKMEAVIQEAWERLEKVVTKGTA